MLPLVSSSDRHIRNLHKYNILLREIFDNFYHFELSRNKICDVSAVSDLLTDLIRRRISTQPTLGTHLDMRHLLDQRLIQNCISFHGMCMCCLILSQHCYVLCYD